MTVVLLALVLPTVRAECPASPEALKGYLDDAMQAYVDLDPDAFAVARDAGREALECVDQPLDASLAGAYHRMEGLSGLVSRDDRRTLNSFRASVAVEPAWEMPEDVAPPGHPLSMAYEAARMAAPSARVSVSVPRCSVLYVDGVQTTARPRDRPAILQIVNDEDAAVLWTSYIAPPAEPPSWGSIPAIATMDCDEPVALEEPDRSYRALLIGSGVTALTSGVLATGALVNRARYIDQDYVDRASGEELRARANTLFYGAQAAAALSVGLGGTGIAMRVVW